MLHPQLFGHKFLLPAGTLHCHRRRSSTMPGSFAGDSSGTSPSPAARSSRKKAASVSDTMGSTYAAMVQEGIDDIVKELNENPSKVFPTLRFVRADMDEKATAEKESKPVFPSSYVRLNQCPKAVVFKHLTMFENKLFPDVDICMRLEKATKGVCHNLWYMALAVSPNTKWPKFGHDRAVFDQIVMQAYTEAGDRLSSIVVDHNSNGEPIVDFQKCGIYKLSPDGNAPKKELKHKFGGTAAIQSVLNIADNSYNMTSNHLECAAKVQHGRVEVGLASLFPDSESATFLTVRANERLAKIAADLWSRQLRENAGEEDDEPSPAAAPDEPAPTPSPLRPASKAGSARPAPPASRSSVAKRVRTS